MMPGCKSYVPSLVCKAYRRFISASYIVLHITVATTATIVAPSSKTTNHSCAAAVAAGEVQLTFARVLRMAMISSRMYWRVRIMTSLSSKSTGMPWGDSMSVPLICNTHNEGETGQQNWLLRCQDLDKDAMG